MALRTVPFLNFGVCQNMVPGGRFTKLTEIKTYSVESIVYSLYTIYINFGLKKFVN